MNLREFAQFNNEVSGQQPLLQFGPNDSSDANVNWQHSFLKETCGWETVEINLNQFGYGYNPSNLDRTINFGNLLRIKASTNIYGSPTEQMIQFDNVSFIVK
jgi:hypothetical protein